MKTTRKDVATLAGVSLTTVSDVLNGTPDARIREETRKRVQRAAGKLNYQPNFAARGLVLQKSFNIGIVACAGNDNPSLSINPFALMVLDGVQKVLANTDYHVSYFSAPSLDGFDYKALFRKRRVDGLVIIQTLFSDLEVLEADAEADQYPIILVSNYLPGTRLSYVDVDNRDGIFQAMDHLVKLGYRRIGFASGPLNQRDFVDRLDAYRAALLNHGLPSDPDMVVGGRQGDYIPVVRGWISKGAVPEAVVAANDMLAIRMIRALKSCGLSVPADAGVVGFDDQDISSFFEPSITTVRQPMREIGSAAAGELIRMLEKKDEPRKQVKRTFPPELVVRESCGAGLRNRGNT